MVAYGDALRRTRRPGWEDAYVDYEALRTLLEGIEGILKRSSPSSSPDQTNHKESSAPMLHQEEEESATVLQHKFLVLLRKEIEKVSLFILSRQGEIAEAVGALRFDELAHANLQIRPGLSMLPSSSEDAQDLADVDTENLGEEATLLPSGSIVAGPLKTPNPMHKKFATPSRPIFQGQLTLHTTKNKTDAYTALGVEILHLLRFICANAMGFRKILKKHDKIMLGASIPPPSPPVLEHSHKHHQSTSSTSSRLVNGPEDHLQQLANSASVAAIHSSLLAALLEMKLSDNNDHAYQSIEDGSTHNYYDYPLIRLQCTVSSIQVLREYAQRMDGTFHSFLSQKAMIATGKNSGGLQAATQQALSLMMRFQPDSLLLMDNKALEEWQNRVLRMHQVPELSSAADFDQGEVSWGGANASTMLINLMSTLLYTVNYYIVAPTANHYAILLGTDGAFGATLVGASSFAAIFAALLYSLWYTKSSFRSALLFSTLCPCVGNLLYALAISYRSMGVAIFGRILVGFGSAEVVNRQLISACVSFRYMTAASALFVAAGAVGMSVGPLLAAILDMASGRDTDVNLKIPFLPSGGLIYNHVTSPGFVMAFLWFLEMMALVILFREPERVNARDAQKTPLGSPNGAADNQVKVHFTEYGTTEAFSPKPVKHSSRKGGIWSEIVTVKTLIFDNAALPVTLLLFGYIELVDEVLISSCSMVCLRYFGWYGSRAGLLIASLGSLVLPAHFVVERASHRFEERGIMKYSILFICASLFAILNYEGLIFDLIYVAVEAVEPDEIPANDTTSAETEDKIDISVGGTSISSFLNDEQEVPYDWGVGNYVYITFLSAIFMGTIILEGVDTSAMAKATPPALNDTFINSGLLATLVGTLGRVVGDSMITLSALVDKDIFTDFVNATFFPMIPLGLIGYYLVRRNYRLFASRE